MNDPAALRLQRLAAAAALLLAVASVALAVVIAVGNFPRGVAVAACAAAAVLAGWYAVRRRGPLRILAATGCITALAGAIALIVLSGDLVAQILILCGLLASVAAARSAFSVHPRLAPAPRPRRPVMFWNPRSGGGKAQRAGLAQEARARGIEPIEIHRGDDLVALATEAVRRGADALAVAGGDGSQAIVAMVAARLDVPYACIPAGTRNHFALDLGVDRDDPVGALDALTMGGERRVDLAEVNGRVFVNNVSLGLYGEAVQQRGYRDAKLRTLLATVPDVAGPDAAPPQLRWRRPEIAAEEVGVMVLVSNNRYRLGQVIGAGTRPRLDTGRLGVAAVAARTDRPSPSGRPVLRIEEWSTPQLEVTCDQPTSVGIDGEAVVLEPPLRFRIWPRALRVRISRRHPGAAPAALAPESPWQTMGALCRLAISSKSGDERASESATMTR